ncbi:MAG: 5-formyltetrahydrofolate cyclo-ligase [Nostocaceae cyanobacterium]|nr:5-formyltetrahydrofolate cyclo-ligase [Nostocaceae cyanobacterium]
MNKAELRQNLLKQRKSMAQEDWRQKSDRITQHLYSSPLFNQAQTILAYFSFQKEPDLSPLFTDDRFQWGFPRCVGKSLHWHIMTPNESVEIGKYGIREPHGDAPVVNSEAVDLILVPTVACDYQGYRLGYGGGYYDRLLSSPEWVNKVTIGIAFDFAYLPQLPVEPWDRRLQGVCTESGFKMV